MYIINFVSQMYANFENGFGKRFKFFIFIENALKRGDATTKFRVQFAKADRINMETIEEDQFA